MAYQNITTWLRPALEVAGGFLALLLVLMGLFSFSANLLTRIGALFMGAAFLPKIRKIGSVPINAWVRGGVFLFGFLLIGQGEGDIGKTVPQGRVTQSVPQVATLPLDAIEVLGIVQDSQGSQVEEKTVKQPANGSTVFVTEVTDGDTIKVRMPDEMEEAVRTIGIDTPETRPTECFGREATEKMRSFVEGKTVILERDPADDRDNFGRLLRYVSVNGMDVGAAMIRDGYAHSYKKYPHPRLEEYNLLEREARDAYRGLWGDVCGVPKAQGESSQEEEQAEVTPSPTPNAGGGQTNPFPDQQPSPEGQECIIKGNVNSDREKIYHYPGCGSYERTKVQQEEGDRWFCTEQEAIEAGFRRAGNC